MNNFDELLDVVNENDQVVDVQPRSIVYQNRLPFRVINAFIINKEGQLWIPRRSYEKKLFPGCLDMSVGGHVSSGESYEQAFIRETHEEVGLILTDAIYKTVARLTPHEQGTSAFMWIYFIYADQVPAYNTADFCHYEWLTVDQLKDRLQAGEKAKNDLPIIIHYLKEQKLL